MAAITLTINGKQVSAEDKQSILGVAQDQVRLTEKPVGRPPV